MKEEKLVSRHMRRKQRSLTDSSAARDDSYKNLVRDLEITMGFQVLSSDITYIPTAQGFEYQCNIIDIHTKEVLGTAQRSNMKAGLVEEEIGAFVLERSSAYSSYQGFPGIVFLPVRPLVYFIVWVGDS
ncbi:MAG: hypothetical protein GX046_07765 [Tissierellia bacterium]|nr:hypothetical protein [Tissierellia bacterium]